MMNLKHIDTFRTPTSKFGCNFQQSRHLNTESHRKKQRVSYLTLDFSYSKLYIVCYSKQAYRSIINPDWNFEKMGVGGLDQEFSAIFRRSFASRVFPPEFIDQLGLSNFHLKPLKNPSFTCVSCISGMKHVRGILLFGPPGTGKTLMARQIGKMLNAREPKIINGPQILDKYVGESEANIRKLFADAEEESKRVRESVRWFYKS